MNLLPPTRCMCVVQYGRNVSFLKKVDNVTPQATMVTKYEEGGGGPAEQKYGLVQLILIYVLQPQKEEY